MSQKRVTYYTCDKCGSDVGRKRELRRFAVETRQPYNAVSFDLCGDCEGGFLSVLAAYVPDGQNPNDLSRASA